MKSVALLLYLETMLLTFSSGPSMFCFAKIWVCRADSVQFISKTLILRANYLHSIIGMFCFALHGADGF